MGAWIETGRYPSFLRSIQSHPLWVRGLKPTKHEYIHTQHMSHPLWVRGLKQRVYVYFNRAFRVASFMGAWIETKKRQEEALKAQSHPLWVRGLKR